MSLLGGDKYAPITCIDYSRPITFAYILSIFQECDITRGDIKEVNQYLVKVEVHSIGPFSTTFLQSLLCLLLQNQWPLITS